MKLISVVLPCFNEEGGIIAVLDAVSSAVKNAGHCAEIVVVDDGSTDGTWMLLKKAVLDYDSVRALRLSRNFGKESAIAAGLDAASGDAVIVMDADLQHPPSLISEMIRAWEGGAHVVEAVKERRARESLGYRLMSILFYGLLRRAAGLDLTRSSDFKLLDRKVVTAWQNMTERNLFFRGIVDWMGFSTVQIAFSVPERTDGESRWTLPGLVNLALTGITAYSSLPLRLVTLLGTVFLVFALVVGTRAIIIKITHDVLDGITLLVLLNLVVGSCVMISLGLIGEYIARIYTEVKLRPRFIMSEEAVSTPSDDAP